MILQFTTARLITIYDNVLLQFTISWLSQFSTTVITIYHRYYNFMTGITIHDRGTCWHYLMMSQYKKISLFSKRICQVINQTRYQNVSLSERGKRLNSTWPIIFVVDGGDYSTTRPPDYSIAINLNFAQLFRPCKSLSLRYSATRNIRNYAISQSICNADKAGVKVHLFNQKLNSTYFYSCLWHVY